MAASTKVYELVTKNVLEMLDAGVVPWKKPWNGGKYLPGTNAPRNAKTGRAYRGINAFLLGATGVMKGWDDLRFATYKQISEAGGQVTRGEKGSLVTYWNVYVKHAKNEGCKTPAKVDWIEDTCVEECNRFAILKYFTVFNVAQQTGAKFPEKFEATEIVKDETEFCPIEDAERVFTEYVKKAEIPVGFGGDRAFYVPSEDRIQLPNRDDFDSPEGFYDTAFHEAAHSTGHESRLARGLDKSAAFGSHDYGTEELTAEFASAFVNNTIGLEDRTEQAAAYINSWKKTIKADVKLVVTAATAAQKAADMILGIEESK